MTEPLPPLPTIAEARAIHEEFIRRWHSLQRTQIVLWSASVIFCVGGVVGVFAALPRHDWLVAGVSILCVGISALAFLLIQFLGKAWYWTAVANAQTLHALAMKECDAGPPERDPA
jgi:hypothetical protein